MESLLRLNISCLAPTGKEVAKLRIALLSSNTVQHLLKKVESHSENIGHFDLRLKDSGAYLHSDDTLKDVLKESERDLEAVPKNFRSRCHHGEGGALKARERSRSRDSQLSTVTVQQDYIANEKYLKDPHCNYLSCRAHSSMEICGKANGWVYCRTASGEEGWLPEWVFEEDMHGHQPLDGVVTSVVDRIAAKTSGYVDSLTFYMKDGREYRYGNGGYRDVEVWLERDERILSVLQKQKQSLGEIVFTTSKRQLVFRGFLESGKRSAQRNFFECQPGHQIHHLEMQHSVICGIHVQPVQH